MEMSGYLSIWGNEKTPVVWAFDLELQVTIDTKATSAKEVKLHYSGALPQTTLD